jgi:L-lysine 2,3-aminomutase
MQAAKFQAITARNVAASPIWASIPNELREAILVVSKVLPFRTNRYIVEELIDWGNLPDDPMFQLTFPQPGMLQSCHYLALRRLLANGEVERLRRDANLIRMEMNPHPGGQMEHNVPRLDGRVLRGLQHKYRETVLFFPGPGQTCHAYCSYCFRWAQFVDLPDLRFRAEQTGDLVAYLAAHPDVSDLLVTGGDPMVMSAGTLRRYLEPLLQPGLEHLRNIRIGTKAPAFWPQRFVTDPDADEVLRLFEEIVASGRHLAVMAHYSHPVELSTPMARRAASRIRATGAEIRIQAPVIHHVNDAPSTWLDLCSTGVGLGMIPYYMFVERDTGPRRYFELPLVRTSEIYSAAMRGLSGLGRTLRGPIMSTTSGKVRILGVSRLAARDIFVLDFLQARDPDWVGRPFFAELDPNATWFDQLRPATPEHTFFFAPLPHAGPYPPR